MIKKIILIFVFLILSIKEIIAGYPIGDKWYENPLGFEPIKLHTSMGLIVPSAIAGACLLFTEKDSTLQNKISIYNENGFSWGYKYPHTFISQTNTGFDYMLRKWMSVGAEFDLYFAKDGYNDTQGIAIRPFARFYAINQDKFKIYFESGGGLVYFFNYFPKPSKEDNRKGTYLNGTTKYGIGAIISISKSNSIIFGIRHLHISNGNTKGVERNPSHDSNGFFVGFQYSIF